MKGRALRSVTSFLCSGCAAASRCSVVILSRSPALAPDEGAYEAMIGEKGAQFRVVSAQDGSTLAELGMKQVPVFDGLIAAAGRLYMSTIDGTLVCFGEKQAR